MGIGEKDTQERRPIDTLEMSVRAARSGNRMEAYQSLFSYFEQKEVPLSWGLFNAVNRIYEKYENTAHSIEKEIKSAFNPYCENRKSHAIEAINGLQKLFSLED